MGELEKRNRISLDFVLLFFIGVFCQINPLFSRVVNMIVILFLFLFFILSSYRKKFRIGTGIKWYGLFAIYAFSTLIYTVNTINPDYSIIRIFTCLIVGFLASQTVEFENDSILYFLNGIIVGGIMGVCYVLLKQYSLIGIARLGKDIYGSSVQFGNIIIMTIYALIWKLTQNKKNRVLNIFLIVFMFFAALTSGTRKAILMPVLFYTLLLLLNPQKKLSKKTTQIIIFSILFILFIYFSLNNSYLYSIIGRRLDTLINSVGSQEIEDGSAAERTLFKELAFRLFMQRPIFGYGIHGFAYMNYCTYGKLLYAHDNVLDILSCLGLIGFFLFYRIYFIIFINIKKIYNYIIKNNIALFLLSFTIITFIMEPYTMTHLSQVSVILLSCTGEMVDYIKRRDVRHEHEMAKNNL